MNILCIDSWQKKGLIHCKDLQQVLGTQTMSKGAKRKGYIIIKNTKYVERFQKKEIFQSKDLHYNVKHIKYFECLK